MSNKQLIVLWIGVGLIVLMCLCPPWLYQYSESSYPRRRGGGEGLTQITVEAAKYGFNGYDGIWSDQSILDIRRLIAQCVITALLTATIICTLRVKGK